MNCDIVRLFVVAYRAVVTVSVWNVCFMCVGICVCA